MNLIRLHSFTARFNAWTAGLILIVVPVFSWCPALAREDAPARFQCVTFYDYGKINWSTGKITAIGRATPEGNKESDIESVPGSARADANWHIIEILKQIKIHNRLTIGTYASKNDVILAGIEKTARDAVTIRQTYTSALDVEILIETSIFGGLLQLVLPDDIRQIPGIRLDRSLPVQTPMGKIPYTGLILDTRGLGVEPVLYPVIVNEQGREIYSSLFVSREFAVQYGVCIYLCDMDRAAVHPRIGSNPLIVKGLRKSGKDDTSIIISMTDAKKIEKVKERHEFFKECRIIIVTDG